MERKTGAPSDDAPGVLELSVGTDAGLVLVDLALGGRHLGEVLGGGRERSERSERSEREK